MPRTLIALLNYNGLHWLEQMLPPLVAHTTEADILLIDNASADNSVAFVKQHFPHINCVLLPENMGFCRAYNAVLLRDELCGQYDYFVLLNTDVYVPEAWLQPLIHHMELNTEVAACQPKILRYDVQSRLPISQFEYAGAAGGFIDYWGYPFCRGRLFEHCEVDSGQYNTVVPVAWASGACLCIRVADWKAANGFDDIFFAHMEEIDLCLRLWSLGRQVQCLPHTAVYHVGGGTLPKGVKKTFLNFRNNLFLLYKHLPVRIRWQVIGLRLLLDGLAACWLSYQHRTWAYIWAVVRAHMSFYWHLPRLKPLPASIWQVATYPRSILVDYFIRKKKAFSLLGWQLELPTQGRTVPAQKVVQAHKKGSH